MADFEYKPPFSFDMWEYLLQKDHIEERIEELRSALDRNASAQETVSDVIAKYGRDSRQANMYWSLETLEQRAGEIRLSLSREENRLKELKEKAFSNS